MGCGDDSTGAVAGSGGSPVGCDLAVDCSEESIVVDVAWLSDRLGDPSLQLIDTRPAGYDDARIAGAIHLLPSDLSATVQGVSSQAAPVTEARAVLRAAGLKNGTTAVVYGDSPEYSASRMVWLLRYYGHGDVRYLDGGWQAWLEADGELETVPVSVPPSQYIIMGIDESLRVTGDWVLSQLGEPPYDSAMIQLVDARTQDEFDRGRIPSARLVPWTFNLENGRLLAEGGLSALYEGLDPNRTTVTYCQTGQRGSFAWLALQWLGYSDVRLYDGSWVEWGDGAFPVESP
jgi:thiosulfate/3-mercaptopyruvate sulfurtransferase